MQSENSNDFSLTPPTPSTRGTFKGLLGPAHNRIDLTGQVFSALTVLSYHGTTVRRQSLWACRCECGNESIVSGSRLRSRKTRSCGCLQKYCRSKFYYKSKYDFRGQVFGRLTVLDKTDRPADAKAGNFWLCRCECGQIKAISSYSLIRKNATSCGCARAEFLNKKDYGKAAENSVILMYRKSASSRKIPYELSDEECVRLAKGHCHYCGCGPKNVKFAKSYNGKFYYNGIDRIDNNRGYESTNVVTCCIDCNRAKRQMGYQEFLDWVARVYRYVVAPTRAKQSTAASLPLF